MDLLKGILVAGALALAGPVWADGGHGRDRDRDHRGWRGHDRAPAWGHYQHRHRHWDRAPRSSYYGGRNYYSPYGYAAPYSSYGYAAPAPGIHIVTPDIYIPLR